MCVCRERAVCANSAGELGQLANYMQCKFGGSCHVCLSVCVCVCPLSHISPLGLLFVLKTRLRTHRETKVKKFVVFSLKLCRSRATALPALYGYHAVGHFLSVEYTCALLKCHVNRGVEFGQYKKSLSSLNSAAFMPLMFTK